MMDFEDLAEAEEVAVEFRGRARELRVEAAAAEPGRGLMLNTLAGDYERRATRLELYVESVRDVAEGHPPSPWHTR
jgi:hypothetical protein